MDAADLDYALPEELIAQRPVEPRSDARMLVVPAHGRAPREHLRVRELATRLRPSLLVVNDTRVIPARLFGRRAPGGGRVELLLLERASAPGDVERWTALGRASKPLRPGTELTLDGGARARILERGEPPELLVELSAEEPIAALLERVGHMPLPPYVTREDDEADRARYQTIFATHPGAVAAPTAGLHFDDALLAALEEAGHTLARVTLHVGAGTFRPVKAARLEDHPMHEERFEVSEVAARAIGAAQAEGRPIVAVGTTVVRALESAWVDGALRAGPGRTRLLIQPGFTPRVVDGLLTNFHLPRSTLLALVMALAGETTIRDAYAEAVRARYRFYSYGDAMLIPPDWRLPDERKP